MKQKKSASILKKFLLFNFTVFSVLGIFTIIYLEAIQPNLVKNRTINHKVIISNTVDNFERLSIDFTKEGIRTFLLSARFLFQSLDRVQFYDLGGNLIGDTNILDLDQSVFSRSDFIIEETNYGRLLYFNKDASVQWQYVNRADNGNVYYVSWSRILYKPEDIKKVRKILEIGD